MSTKTKYFVKLFLMVFSLFNYLPSQNLDSLVSLVKDKQVIKDNWCQYFANDLSTLYTSNNIFPLKFDSYGLIYPDNSLLKEVNLEMIKKNGQAKRKHTKYSILHMFEWYYDRLRLGLNDIKDTSRFNFYKALIDKFPGKYYSVSEFNEKWHQFHFNMKIKELNQIIEESGIKKIIFFCHGYNVPYSLAAMQFNFIIDFYKLDDKHTLFIPVYWPSNDLKKCLIKKNGKVNFKDKVSLNNGLLFLRYSNQAYFAGLSLRQIILGIMPGVEVEILSHSLGATVATTALINTKSKLHRKKLEPINNQIRARMDQVSLPKRKVKVFMSAAAIPGESTFIDFDFSCVDYYTFICGWNRNDKVLNKRFIGLKLGAHRFGCTSLGINWNNDAIITKSNLDKLGTTIFVEKDLTGNKEHDIFSYLRNVKYRTCMNDFLLKN